MSNTFRKGLLAGLALAVWLCLPIRARADFQFVVTLDTTPLASSSDSFALQFQLTDPSFGDGDNTVTVSGFQFGGGSAGDLGSIVPSGGASGDLSSGVVLTEVSFVNSFQQDFNPGNTLSFLVSSSTIVDSSGWSPDSFAFSIVDNTTLTILPTTDPNLQVALAAFDITSTTIGLSDVQTYGSSPGSTPFLDPSGISSPSPATAPEPSSFALLASGIAGIWLWRRRARLRVEGFLNSRPPPLQ